MNKVILSGNVGNEPELRFTNSGKPVCNFRLATSTRWTDDKGDKQEKTEWHRITAFGAVAEHLKEFTHKGDRLLVEGRLQYSSFDTNVKVGGQETTIKRYAVDVIVERFEVFPRAKKEDEPTENNEEPQLPLPF